MGIGASSSPLATPTVQTTPRYIDHIDRKKRVNSRGRYSWPVDTLLGIGVVVVVIATVGAAAAGASVAAAAAERRGAPDVGQSINQ